MIELAQDDFTVKVSGSTTLLELDTELARYGQISTLNGPANYSIKQILSENWGFKNHQAVLGLSMEHHGIQTKCGGQVIKNVSGYDLAKLYIGSRGAYGEITSACLRTEKLATESINYQIPEALWELDLSHWQNCSVEISSSSKIILWGDADLLELRATKLEKQISNYNKEKSRYQKQYLNTKTRIEINTTASSLKDIFSSLRAEGEAIPSLIALPLNSAIYIYTENPATILEKTKKLNNLFSAIIYPINLENQRLEQYYNATKPDEERILEKLYAQFN